MAIACFIAYEKFCIFFFSNFNLNVDRHLEEMIEINCLIKKKMRERKRERDNFGVFLIELNTS